jgi:hypothetical protein
VHVYSILYGLLLLLLLLVHYLMHLQVLPLVVLKNSFAISPPVLVGSVCWGSVVVVGECAGAVCASSIGECGLGQCGLAVCVLVGEWVLYTAVLLVDTISHYDYSILSASRHLLFPC